MAFNHSWLQSIDDGALKGLWLTNVSGVHQMQNAVFYPEYLFKIWKLCYVDVHKWSPKQQTLNYQEGILTWCIVQSNFSKMASPGVHTLMVFIYNSWDKNCVIFMESIMFSLYKGWLQSRFNCQDIWIMSDMGCLLSQESSLHMGPLSPSIHLH